MDQIDGPKVRGRVWDPLVRIFHWTLVAAFATAWFQRSDAFIHETAGKIVLVLVIIRTVWGLVGPASARFETFIKGPRTTISYFLSILKGKPAHYIGHNPAGAAMIGLLLLSLVTTTASGILMSTTVLWGNPVISAVHGFAADAAVILVFGHLAGVVVASLQHREFLPKPMVSGWKWVPAETEPYLGRSKFTFARVSLAVLFALSASTIWLGSTRLFNASYWRMNKIITSSLTNAGCSPATISGPQIIVYPVAEMVWNVSMEKSSNEPHYVRVTIDEALRRANPSILLDGHAGPCPRSAEDKAALLPESSAGAVTGIFADAETGIRISKSFATAKADRVVRLVAEDQEPDRRKRKGRGKR